MKKAVFKKILTILDDIEILGIKEDDVIEAMITELNKTSIEYDDVNFNDLLEYLFTFHLLKNTNRGIDLAPCATILAKSDSNSLLEALALFECCYQRKEVRNVFEKLLLTSIDKKKIHSNLDELSYSLLTQTSIFLEDDNFVRLRTEYFDDIIYIMNEYENEDERLLVSVTLCSHYAASVISHEDLNTEYKNIDSAISKYQNLHRILEIIPRRGVPSDRNETKILQKFYKDTLFHEFNHICPLCGIDLPQMLIASHIKPFRDCGHVYEAIDHSNGLLLCKNHDYLFDQGYISFNEHGELLISNELKEKESLASYVLQTEFSLPNDFNTRKRKMFFAYHQSYIYRL